MRIPTIEPDLGNASVGKIVAYILFVYCELLPILGDSFLIIKLKERSDKYDKCQPANHSGSS